MTLILILAVVYLLLRLKRVEHDFALQNEVLVTLIQSLAEQDEMLFDMVQEAQPDQAVHVFSLN